MRLRHLLLLLPLSAFAVAQDAETERVLEAVVDQMEQMRQELSTMRKVLEQQEDTISRLERRVNQNYIELDRRVRDGSGGVAAGDSASSSQAVPPSSGDFLARLQVAQGFIESGQLESARNTLSELLLLEPENPDAPLAWYWLGEINMQLKFYEDAEQAFSYLIAVYKDHWRVPAAAFKLGEVFRTRGHTQKARIQYSRVVERYPDSPAARLSALAIDAIARDN